MQVRRENKVYGNYDHAPKDKWLYHYTSFDTFVQIARSQSFRLSRFDKMNDPREFGELRSYKIPENQALLNQVIFAKKYSHVSCFSRDSCKGESTVRRGYEISSMWANYGGNHTGVCLVFDKEKLLKAFSKAFSATHRIHDGSIAYGAESANESLNTNKVRLELSGDLEASAIEFLEKYWWYLKDPDWQHEREYRFTVGANQMMESPYLYFPLEDSVVSICCGSRFPIYPSNLSLLRESAGRLDVAGPDISIISWHGYNAHVIPVGAVFRDERCLVKSAIEKTGLPLPVFAGRIKTPTEEVIDWKEGNVEIPGTASILLKFIFNNPQIINDYAFEATSWYFSNGLTITNKQALINHVVQGHRMFYLHFWSHISESVGTDQSCLSQWYSASFQLEGIVYQTAEHYLIAQKARLFDDKEALSAILNSDTPARAKKLGRAVKNFKNDVWKQHRFDYVIDGNLAKFEQNPELKEFLLNTEDRVLVDADPDDAIWGIGMNASDPDAFTPSLWRGENLLGFALMSVRKQLRDEEA